MSGRRPRAPTIPVTCMVSGSRTSLMPRRDRCPRLALCTTSSTATTYPRRRPRYSAPNAMSLPAARQTPTMATIGCGRGLHSRVDPQGMTASDTADAPLIPTALVAYARQTYCRPLVRLPICTELSVIHLDGRSPGDAAVARTFEAVRGDVRSAARVDSDPYRAVECFDRWLLGCRWWRIGATAVVAAVHAPSDAVPTAATSH